MTDIERSWLEKWYMTIAIIALFTFLFSIVLTIKVSKPITEVTNVTINNTPACDLQPINDGLVDVFNTCSNASHSIIYAPPQVVTMDNPNGALIQSIIDQLKTELPLATMPNNKLPVPNGACLRFGGKPYNKGKLITEEQYAQCSCEQDYYCFKTIVK